MKNENQRDADGPRGWRRTMTPKEAFFLPFCSHFCFQEKKIGSLLNHVKNVGQKGNDVKQNPHLAPGRQTEGTGPSAPPSHTSAEAGQHWGHSEHGPGHAPLVRWGGEVSWKNKCHRTGSGWCMLMKSFIPIYPERLGVNLQPSGQDPNNSGYKEI